MKKLYLLLGMLVSGGLAQAQTCGTTVSTFPYFQNFESGAGGWVAGGTGSTWALGTPAKTVINSAASGTNAWVTNLTGQYGSSEQSFVESPCFNLTTIPQPILEMKVWWNSEFSWDGAVLQSSINGGTTWQNVGAFGDPNNWYTDNTINGAPGGQTPSTAEGWTGRNSSSNGSGGWVIAKHALTGLGGNSNVRLRIAFGSDPSIQDEGFAFDDVSIYQTPTNDVGIIAVTSPVNSTCGATATENVCVTIKNFGTASQSNIPVTYTLNGGTPVNEIFAGPLASNATATYCFTTKANLTAGGNFTFNACTALTGDEVPSNNCISKVTNILNPITTYPHIQDFESATVGAPGTFPAGWSMTPGTGTTPYIWQVNAGATPSTPTGPNVDHTSGLATGKYVFTEASNGPDGSVTELITPCFNLSGLTSPGFDFWYHMAGPGMGTMEVQASSNGGTTWTTLQTYTGPQQTAETAPWLKKTVSLAAYMGQTVKLKFKGTKSTSPTTGSSYEGDMSIDDLKVYNIPTSDAEVTLITLPNSGCGLTATENICITVKNNSNAPISNVPVSYAINGGTPVAENVPGPIAIGASVQYCFTTKANLSAVNTYTFIGKVILPGDGDPSNDTKTGTVTSIPNVSTYPYTQNFESGNGGWISGGTNSSWALGTPAKTIINSAASGTKAWVTNLTGQYNSSEQSFVVGPCFNTSSISAPIIEMKVWWNAEWSWDGAVLQSSIDGGTTWQNVGAFGDPNNWYTDNTLNGAPGGQSPSTAEGWSGSGSGTNPGSGGWVTAKHALTGLGNKTSVLLRIAFGSDPSVNDEGFAFDDVMIYQTPATDAGVIAIITPNSGCGLTNLETVTVTIKNSGSAAISSIPVSYTINAGTPVNEVAPGPIAPNATVNYSFATKANLSAVGTYTIMSRTNLVGDALPQNDATSKVVTSIPSISTLPYTEGFENGNGGWIAGGTSSSWALGTPAKAVINSAGTGTKSWVTNLTGQYNSSENSYVVGPCFNFSGKPDPDFEMKAWWNSEFSWDGAVLQSSIDGGATWQKVGAFGDPNNWYTDNTVNGAPGGQPAATAEAWTGRASSNNGSNGWVKVKHKLTGLGGKSSVQLRIAFGADPSVQDDGFAFDDIRIGDNTNNLAANSITPLTKLCGFGTNEPITVQLENLGSVPASGFTVTYNITGAATATVTQPFTGSLAASTTTNFTFTQGANFSAPGSYTVTVTVNMAGDPETANNTTTYIFSNATFTGMPPVFNFEPTGSGVAQLRTVTKPKSAIVESTDASSPLTAGSTKGMIMDGVDNAAWMTPVGVTDPWVNNMDNFSAAYICFNPSGGSATDSLWLTFDLKQLFKLANANTNFRITVNGTQLGATYRPPFDPTNPATPVAWKSYKVDLYQFRNQGGIQIGLESSVKEAFAAGAGTANLVDNIRIVRRLISGTKADVLASKLHVFPNPSTGMFYVSLENGKAYSLEVTDLAGKTIMQQTAKGDTQLKLENQAKGIYLLKVNSEGKSTMRKLIVE